MFDRFIIPHTPQPPKSQFHSPLLLMPTALLVSVYMKLTSSRHESKNFRTRSLFLRIVTAKEKRSIVRKKGNSAKKKRKTAKEKKIGELIAGRYRKTLYSSRRFARDNITI